MGKACRTLSWIFGIVGSLEAFGLAYQYGVKLKEEYEGYELLEGILSSDCFERDWLKTILVFALVLLGTLVVSVALYTIGEIYDGLCFSIESDKAQAETQEATLKALLSKSSSSTQLNTEEVIPFGGWKCPKCGKIHQGYEKVCLCGYERE